ncbi:hypothetical protein PROFUN_04924 [Planoprotostelium fungivorum]|uniref:Uncharacterized protein n=1 Tax=Planoprotostelium fungivorum TaxID=1890364 RepID=A0A2P6NF89_9EUKA|nr:hypothetical protein PROFUN_04924 [Planoprotostelium fungivorum]
MKAQLLLLLLALTCVLSKTLVLNIYLGNSTSTACGQNNPVYAALVVPINYCVTETFPNGTVRSSVVTTSAGVLQGQTYNASTCTGAFSVDSNSTVVLNQCTAVTDSEGHGFYSANVYTSYTRAPTANDTVSISYEGPDCTGSLVQSITYHNPAYYTSPCNATKSNGTCTTSTSSSGSLNFSRSVCGNSPDVVFPSSIENFTPNTAVSGGTSGGSTSNGGTTGGSGRTSGNTTGDASAATFVSVVVALLAAFAILF